MGLFLVCLTTSTDMTGSSCLFRRLLNLAILCAIRISYSSSFLSSSLRGLVIFYSAGSIITSTLTSTYFSTYYYSSGKISFAVFLAEGGLATIMCSGPMLLPSLRDGISGRDVVFMISMFCVRLPIETLLLLFGRCFLEYVFLSTGSLSSSN